MTMVVADMSLTSESPKSRHKRGTSRLSNKKHHHHHSSSKPKRSTESTTTEEEEDDGDDDVGNNGNNNQHNKNKKNDVETGNNIAVRDYFEMPWRDLKLALASSTMIECMLARCFPHRIIVVGDLVVLASRNESIVRASLRGMLNLALSRERLGRHQGGGGRSSRLFLEAGGHTMFAVAYLDAFTRDVRLSLRALLPVGGFAAFSARKRVGELCFAKAVRLFVGDLRQCDALVASPAIQMLAATLMQHWVATGDDLAMCQRAFYRVIVLHWLGPWMLQRELISPEVLAQLIEVACCDTNAKAVKHKRDIQKSQDGLARIFDAVVANWEQVLVGGAGGASSSGAGGRSASKTLRKFVDLTTSSSSSNLHSSRSHAKDDGLLNGGGDSDNGDSEQQAAAAAAMTARRSPAKRPVSRSKSSPDMVAMRDNLSIGSSTPPPIADEGGTQSELVLMTRDIVTDERIELAALNMVHLFVSSSQLYRDVLRVHQLGEPVTQPSSDLFSNSNETGLSVCDTASAEALAGTATAALSVSVSPSFDGVSVDLSGDSIGVHPPNAGQIDPVHSLKSIIRYCQQCEPPVIEPVPPDVAERNAVRAFRALRAQCISLHYAKAVSQFEYALCSASGFKKK
jgi:hypothetical protein